ncbi:hypothetical protein EB118_14545 [bacterium]|nr:hypothetical protein [bacterium]NDD83693.1 hypothetical protein [bacterium]NDG31275.1 hypothetical protein [bacterium]
MVKISIFFQKGMYTTSTMGHLIFVKDNVKGTEYVLSDAATSDVKKAMMDYFHQIKTDNYTCEYHTNGMYMEIKSNKSEKRRGWVYNYNVDVTNVIMLLRAVEVKYPEVDDKTKQLSDCIDKLEGECEKVRSNLAEATEKLEQLNTTVIDLKNDLVDKTWECESIRLNLIDATNKIKEIEQLNEALTDTVDNQETIIEAQSEKIIALYNCNVESNTETNSIGTQTELESDTTAIVPYESTCVVDIPNSFNYYNYYQDNNLQSIFEYTTEPNLFTNMGYANHSFAPEINLKDSFRNELKDKLRMPNYGLKKKRNMKF